MLERLDKHEEPSSCLAEEATTASSMASSRSILASLVLLFLLVGLVEPSFVSEFETRTGRSLLGGIDCGAACSVRCSKSSRPNLCKRACGTCCSRCSCVPPGTYGNYDSCPCYFALTTRGGARKCP